MIHRTAATRVGRAFTLIEVMIAVLVLALGLLGLGAVFPVAVRAQRVSTDETMGTAAANAARAFLSSYDYRSAMQVWGIPNSLDNRNFWRDWRDAPIRDGGFNTNNPGGTTPYPQDDGYWYVPQAHDVSNILRIGVRQSPPTRPRSSEVFIPIRERLWPMSVAGTPAPQFVWDFAVHRVPDFNPATDATHDDLELAVFVRRLDPRIRPDAGVSVYEALTGESANNGPAVRRRPVAVIPTGPRAGMPSGDGVGNYANLLTVEVEFRFNPPGQPDRDRLYVVGATPVQWELVRQPGQKLVDNLGQIHTVRTWEENGSNRYVVLESPVKTPARSRENIVQDVISQVVFAPQTPVNVFVMKVKP